MSNKTSSKHLFWGFFITNFRITYLIIAAITVFGVFAIIVLPKESAPNVDIPVAVITTPFPGAGAQNVEELVTDPLEDRLEGMSDMNNLTSTSQQGLSIIQLEFDANADTTEVFSDIRARIDRAKADLPNDAGEPTVRKVSFSDVPIMTIAVSGDRDPSELKPYAEDLQDELEGIRNVSQVNIIGVPKREITVTVNTRSLEQFGLSLEEVTAALGLANTDVPVGAIETADTVYTVSFDGRLTDAESVRSVGVSTQNGVIISVGDIAEVTDTYTDQSRITRFSNRDGDVQPAVSLQVFKESGQGNILTIDSEARSIAAELEGLFPSGVSVQVVQSDADQIKSDLNNLVVSGVFTMLIIFTLLAVFLGWQEALLASVVVPVSFLIAFVAIWSFGLTINFLTLFSLILSLGILVDAAIVVTESIFNKRAAGADGITSAMETIDIFQVPLVAGTMTTVFVFLPMLLTSGTIGEFIKSIPIVVSSVLIAALFVAMGIVTTLATRFLKNSHTDTAQTSVKGVQRLLALVYDRYQNVLKTVVISRRRSYQFLASVGLLFVISVLFPITGITKIDMFPAADQSTIFLDLEASSGTPLRETDAILQRTEQELVNDERVEFFLTTAGQAAQAGEIDSASVSNSHIGSITIELTDERSQSAPLIADDLQTTLGALISEANIKVSAPGGGPGQGAAVQLRIVGDELAEMERVAQQFADKLETVDGAVSVDDGINETAGEFSITIDRYTANRFGVTPQQIASVLRTAVSGNTATDIPTIEETIDVNVALAFNTDYEVTLGSVKRVSIDELRNVPIVTNRGSVPLDTFADISLTAGRSSINHENGDRVISVTAQTAPKANTGVIINEMRTFIDTQTLPDGITVEYGGEAEDIQESFTDLGMAMLLGVFIIFSIMVWQFNSYRQPLFIILTIPLAMTGVFIGLALVKQPLSFPAFIGIVALAGVVVNNAIILIDSINNERRINGKDIATAVIDGANSRIQPVILTTLTTVFGLIPLVFTSPTWAPVAYSIIFGLLYASVLTLFVIPIVYNRFAERVLDQQ